MTANELQALADRADAIRTLLPFASRPFVLEFAGTPKAGKSTSVETISHFFRRSSFRVHVLTERASVCPIPMKGHLFFNTWCACTMLAEMLENIETSTDLIIKDRGLFDTLIWLQRQVNKGEVNADERGRIEQFLLMDRWKRLVDLVVVTTVAAEEAIRREHAPRISLKIGSIMNVGALESINDALELAIQAYRPHFKSISVHQTTDSTPRNSNVKIAHDVLNHFEEFLNPEIMVLQKDQLADIPLMNGGCFERPACADVLKMIQEKARFVRRSDAEGSPELVQIVPCALLVHNHRVFLFQRAERDPKYQLYGKSSIWQGSHVPHQPEAAPAEQIEHALAEKLRDKLFLSRQFNTEYLGYSWDRDDIRSNKHFGLIFRVEIDSDDVATDLQKKEFRRGRGYGLFGQFLDLSAVNAQASEIGLESWSRAVLSGSAEVSHART